ncbi:MAG: sedoheptulose 7-phosphate cyclase [Alphaproteobacteria bacterium]
MKVALKHWRVSQKQLIQYDVIRSSDVFDENNDLLISSEKNGGNRRFVVVDQRVYDIFSDKIHKYFRQKGIIARIVPISTGEANKSISNYTSLLEELDSFSINRRNEPIICIGGGVLTDLVGFVASTYRRGIPRINVPTTIMGYVDAAIGIKTGINFNESKNRVGTFSCPQKVLLDKTFFSTLERRHILNGVGEIVKLAIIKDSNLFTALEKYGKACISSKFQDDKGDLILERAIDSIIQELEPNLFEDNLSRSADFGHTFSTALEMQKGSDLLHGEAVVIDCVFSSMIAFKRGLLSKNQLDGIVNLVLELDVLVDCPWIEDTLLWDALMERTYHRNGLQRLPLPCAIGEHIFVNDVEFSEVHIACEFFKKWMCEKWKKLSILI